MSLMRSAARALVNVAAGGLTASYSYARGVYRGDRGFTSLKARDPLEAGLFRIGAGGIVYMMRIQKGLARVGARIEGVSVQEYERRQHEQTKRYLRQGMAAKYAHVIIAAKTVRSMK